MRLLGDEWVADEVTQVVFIRIWRSGVWAEMGYPETYIRRAIYFEGMKLLRPASMQVKQTQPITRDLPDPAMLPDRSVELQEELERVRDRVEGLPTRCRAAALLYMFGGMTQREVAKRLEIGVNAVEKQLARARRILRDGALD